jgi:TRAP-type uncharacterized transport system substrate-binding protein
MPTHFLPRWVRVILVFGTVLLAAGAVLFGFRYYTQPVTLTVAAGSLDGEAARVLSAISVRLVASKASVRLKILDQGTAFGAAKAFSEGKVDLAMVRSDIGDLSSARTVLLMSHAVVLVIALPGTSIKSIADLKGKSVGVIGGPVNRRVVEILSADYDLGRANVQFKDLMPPDVHNAIQTKQVSALLAVVPISEKYLAIIRNFFNGDPRRRPTLIPIESAEAIAAVSKAYESYDLPKGTIRGSPAIPDEDLTTLRIPVHLVAKRTLDDDVVTALTKAIMDARRELVSEYPLVTQIATPSTDKDANIPIHPGAAAFFGGDEKTFFDRHGDQIFYSMLLMGSLTSLLAGAWKFMLEKPKAPGGAPLDRLHGLTMRIREANSENELELIEDEINKILRDELTRIANEESEASALGVAVTRLEHLIDQRSKHLGVDQATPAR